MKTHACFRHTCRALLLASTFQMSVTSLLTAQTTDQDLAAIATWVAVDSATGYEGRTSPAMAAALGGGWMSDAWGNIVMTVGTGSPHRILAWALDRPSYAVSQITDDGHLRVHRIGTASRHPLWDQLFEAQQVRVLTLTGPVAGVVARSNGHFAPQHAKETAVVTADDRWVDVWASSRADVEAMGIALLDPLSRQLPPWPMAGGVAGPDAGRRVAAARGHGIAGRTAFVLSAQQVTCWFGLSSLVARDPKVDAATVLAPGEQARAEIDQRMDHSRRSRGCATVAGREAVLESCPQAIPRRRRVLRVHRRSKCPARSGDARRA